MSVALGKILPLRHYEKAVAFQMKVTSLYPVRYHGASRTER